MARCDCGEDEYCNVCMTPPYKDMREIECGNCYSIVGIFPDDEECPACGAPLTSYEEERARQVGVD